MSTCYVCKSNEGKYKCPTCLIYYCSVICCKKHKEDCTPTEIQTEEPKAKKPKQMYVTQDTVPATKLNELKHDKDLKNLMSNPHLREVLKIIDSAENAEEIMQKAMQEPLFVEFADVCLKTIETSNN